MRKTKSLMRRLQQVGPGGVTLLVRTFFLLTAARLALHFIPVKKIVAFKQRPLKRLTPGGQNSDQVNSDQVDSCTRVRWAVLTAARYSPVRFVCFPQCLAASELLRSAGISSRLHYGVNREGAKLMTHTWLEAAGRIVIGGEVADAFSTLDIY